MNSFLSDQRKVLVAASQPFHIQYHKDPSIGNLFLILLKYTARSLRRWRRSLRSRFSICAFDKTSRVHDNIIDQSRLAEPYGEHDHCFTLNSLKRRERIRVHALNVINPPRTRSRNARTYLTNDRHRGMTPRGDVLPGFS